MVLTDTEETLILEIDKLDEEIKKAEEDHKGYPSAAAATGLALLGLFMVTFIFTVTPYSKSPMSWIGGVTFLIAIPVFFAFVIFALGENDEDIIEGELKVKKRNLIETLKSLGVEYVPKEERLKRAEQLKNGTVKQDKAEQPKAEIEKPNIAEQHTTVQIPVKITPPNEEEGFFD